jgi:hypothetical protein
MPERTHREGAKKQRRKTRSGTDDFLSSRLAVLFLRAFAVNPFHDANAD